MAKLAVTSALSSALLLCSIPADAATSFFFSTGDPDGKMASATRRPAASGALEIESADDFVLPTSVSLTSASFTGLLTGGASASNVSAVVVEIYRVFPEDSDLGRTPDVPTRVNSPSDVALTSRDSGAGQLTFTVSAAGSFTASNSVLPGGIHPIPGQTTGGGGSASGEEVTFDVSFSPFALEAGHYFFVPQVGLTDPADLFLWLSAPKPVVVPGTPFAPDLQSWTRDAALDPDWLRIGTDIVGAPPTPAPTFNAVFSLSGTVVPEPATTTLLAMGLGGALLRRRRTG